MSAPSSPPSNEIVPMSSDVIASNFLATTKTFDRIKETFEMIGVQTQKNTDSICAVSSKINQLTDFAQILSKNVENIATEGARIAKDVDQLRGELRELKKKGTRSTQEASLRHFTLHYLMRLGMDTRLGYMCAVPVMGRNNKVYVVISLNLMATTCGRFFKAHKDGKTITKFQTVFESVKDNKQTLVEKAMKMLAFKEKRYTSAEGSTWVVLKVEEFVEMCKEALEDGEDEWEGMDTVMETKDMDPDERGYSFSRQTNCSENRDVPNKMSWGVKMPDSLLKSEHMVAYREIIGGELNVDPTEPHHFSAHKIFPSDDDVPPRRRGKSRENWGAGSTKGYAQPISDVVMEDESGGESESDSDSDDEDGGSKRKRDEDDDDFEDSSGGSKRKRDEDGDDFEETAEEFEARYIGKLAQCGPDSSELTKISRKRRKH